VSDDVGLPSRAEAIDLLRTQRAEIAALLERLAPRDRTRGGLGGGDWSPKDLVSHLESWERYALEALEAWDRGERPPIDRVLWSSSTSKINAEAVEKARGLTWPQATRRAEATHAELLEAIGAMSDARWNNPATARAKSPVGRRIGQLLGGPSGMFSHDRAHLKDLRLFVREESG
jgi:Protein of unknown function (DUF1706)